MHDVLCGLTLREVQKNNDPSIFVEIMSLVHLRFLVFRTTLNIKFLPWFMLENLQIKVCMQVYNSITLEPLEIWVLSQLRHMYFNCLMLVHPRASPRLIHNNLNTIISWLIF